MENNKFVYVTYISTTPKKVWTALTDPKLTAKYWQHVNLSDWKQGSRWEHRRSEKGKTVDMIGKVLKTNPPRQLSLSWAIPSDEGHKEKYSRVGFKIDQVRNVVRLTVTHDKLEPDSDMFKGITDGWPKVLSSLKSLLEAGRPLPKLW
jgi:uncharacterized protein YndB with AHSA1/START domain